MSIIYKTAVCSLVVLAIAGGFNTAIAHENEHERYEAEEFSLRFGATCLTQKMVTPLKFRH